MPRAGQPSKAPKGPAEPVERIAELERALEVAKRRAAAAVKQRNAMARSMSWRITAPLRWANRAVPKRLRTQLRKSVKALRLVATPWRLPARLQQRRAQLELATKVRDLGIWGDYQRWIHDHERWTSQLDPKRNQTHLSIVVPAHGDVDAIERTLASLLAQTYEHWDVVVACETEELRQRIADTHPDEPRIATRQVAGDNTATVDGTFVGFLDAGDILAPEAFNEVAAALAAAPDSDILYSDEDELTTAGDRVAPYLKPEWSPDLLYAFNYFGRLTLLRHDLVSQAGGFDAAMAAGAEWDLNLRVSDLARTITRIPKVLCHRREGSDRERPPAESAAAGHHRDAIRAHWARHGVDATVETQPDGTQHASWTIDRPPLVSVIIPTKDKVELLRVAVEGLLHNTDYRNLQVIIVDTGSTEPDTLAYYDKLAGHPEIRIVYFEKTFNYSAACNFGAGFADGEFLLFLNNDVEVISSDWLDELVRFAMRPGVGVVGTKLVYPSGQLQHAGVGLGINLVGLMYSGAGDAGWGVFGSPDHPRNWLTIMGACQMVRRTAFARVGGFDESYQVSGSDTALCMQIWRAGYRTAYAPRAALVHHEGATRGSSNASADIRRLADDILRLGIDEDPYLHPELSATSPVPTLRLGRAKSVAKSAMTQASEHASPRLERADLDLGNDEECLRAARRRRSKVLWSPQPAHAVSDVWTAARWCLDLLRTRPDVRSRFPRAMSDGPDGPFVRWLKDEGATQFDLPDSALEFVRELLGTDLAARARQAFLYDGKAGVAHPDGLLPSGRREMFHWFIAGGRRGYDLRLEEVWWLFWTAAEDPAHALVRAWAFAPAWQEKYPDGVTVFGREAFAAWFAAAFHENGAWVDPSSWPDELPPAEQLQIGYHAHQQWRSNWPDALTDRDQAVGLIDWLQSDEARLAPEVRAWLAALDADQVAADMIKPGVNVIAHFCYPSGLRVSAESMVESMRLAGLETSLRDLRTDRKDDPHHADFRGAERYDVTVIHVQPVPFFDEAYKRADLGARTPRTYRIAYWYWEFDTIPDSWVEHADGADEVWAATEFVAKGLRDKLSIPVRTLFPGVKMAPFERRPKSYFGMKDSEFTFLFAFHMMSVMERKNPLGLIRAFKLAFTKDEPVRLVLKTSFGANYPREIRRLRKAAKGANITVIDKIFTPNDTLAIIDASDAYVSLHRSEGLGLTMAEAMLLGKPVVATNFSGNVDFMDDDNSLLVPYDLVKLNEPIPPYDDAEYEWAEPSVEAAAELMRRLYENPEWAREVGARAQASAEANLSLHAAGDRFAARLQEIQALQHGS